MKKIRLLIADDHLMILEGLREIFAKEPDIDVVAEAKDGNEAVLMAKKTKPDVMIVDISMPFINGLDVIRMVRQPLPETRVVVLTMFHKEPYIRQAFEYGALGYILKTSPTAELLKAIRLAYRGEYCLSTKISSTVIRSYIRNKDSGQKASTSYDLLSDREKQVFRMLIKGQNTKFIADILGISPKTVAKHRAHIMEKLNAGDLVTLIKFALKNDVIDPEELADA
ncbi:MAG: response regulator transcription factor [Desulfobacteraceae bacterium]|jgi:DNA-binding NarL/FixJ family response regulator